MDPVPPDLQALPRVALLEIFANLRNVAPDVLALASTSSLLRNVSEESVLSWKTLCDARWGPDNLNTHLCPHPADPSLCDYKALYLSANGWRRPLRPCALPPLMRSSALDVTAGPDGTAHIVSLFRSTCGKMLVSDPTPGALQIRRRAIFLDDAPAWVGHPVATAWINHAAGLFAMGDARGGVHLIRRTPVDAIPQDQENLDDLISYHGDGPGSNYPVTCLRHHAESNSLAALWDRGESEGWHPHAPGGVKVLDVATPGSVAAVGIKGAMTEVFDHYELCTISSIDSSGFLWTGGSVKLCQDRADGGGVCPRCDPALPASLCHHQHRSSQAALLFFDIRAGERPGSVVSRHTLPHRSLFPRIETARGADLLLISSVGSPLAVWDRRKLDSGPVAVPSLALPGNPEERRTDALCLSLHGGTVAGRTEDGCVGVWDLETLLKSDKAGLAPTATAALPRPLEPHPETMMPVLKEVWLGPDWVVVNAMLTLCCLRLVPATVNG